MFMNDRQVSKKAKQILNDHTFPEGPSSCQHLFFRIAICKTKRCLSLIGFGPASVCVVLTCSGANLLLLYSLANNDVMCISVHDVV